MIITDERIRAKIYYEYNIEDYLNIQMQIFLSSTFAIFSVFHRIRFTPPRKTRGDEEYPKKWWYCNNKRWRDWLAGKI